MSTIEIQNVLSGFGCSKSEISVFQAAMKLGLSTAAAIAKESCVKRSNTYHVLESLRKRGLISSLEKDTMTYFQSAGVDVLEDQLDEKINQLQHQKMNVELIREKIAAEHGDSNSPHVTFFEGRAGAYHVWKDMLRIPEGETIYDIEASHLLHQPRQYSEEPDSIIEKEWAHFTFRRMEKHINIKFISTTPHEISERLQKQYVNRFIDALMVPKELWPYPLEMGAYANKFYVLTYSKHPIALVLENNETAEAFKFLFNKFWEWCEKQKTVTHVTVN